ncbi:MAG: transglutaminase family protein [Pseudomonadota bacterium]
MIYDITLRIYYEYAQATDMGRQVVRVLPRARAQRQRLLRSNLAIRPEPIERRRSEDFFGNELVELGFDCFSADFELVLRARVERDGSSGGLDLSPDLARMREDLAMENRLDAASPLHFLGNSARVRSGAVFQDFANSHAQATDTVLESVIAIGQAIHDTMEFVPGATEVNTKPEDAFEARRGVCQDFSHIMIASLRSIGVPAGYVSGFLRTLPPPGQARLEGADAMHAWVRAWCGREIGWVDYDPTNAMRAGRDHVEVAMGRDYADVSPVRGVLRSSGASLAGHSVDMVDVAQMQAAPKRVTESAQQH